MSIFVIGDLHLSFNDNKPMDIFGENWKKHEEKIKSNWLNQVKENDVVILPGDFSWATYLEDTEKDFEYLNNLPGKKLLLKEFGSVKQLKEASLEQLEKVLPKEVAANLFNVLKKDT